MVAIPGILEAIFDRFPVRVYQHTSINSTSESNVWNFGAKSKAVTSADLFVLAVHNVREIDLGNGAKRVVPTDPACLGAALILCQKNGLNLPCPHNQMDSSHQLMPLSHQASPDGQMPFLIETGNTQRNAFTTGKVIYLSLSEGVSREASLLHMINEYLSSLQDLWLLALLIEVEKSPESLNSYIYSNSHQRASYPQTLLPISVLTKANALNAVTRTEEFKTIHPELFSDQILLLSALSIIRDLGVKSEICSKKRLKMAYCGKVVEFERIATLLWDFLKTKESEGCQKTIELRFASFLICVAYFLPKTSALSQLVRQKFNHLLSHARQILLEY